MKKIVFMVLIMFATLSAAFAQKIAVLDFKAGVGISQSDVDGISAVFTTYFSPRGYTIVERSQIDRILREQDFQGSYFTEIEDVVELGRILNVNKIVVGDVNIVSGQYNVDVRVVDVQAAYITGKDGATFPKGTSYRETMKKMAERLASQIAVVVGSTGEAGVLNKPEPITLHEYLIVYPEDLGFFSSEPTGIISALNNNKSYGHDDWRLPTEEELAVIKGAKGKINLNGIDYMTVENCEEKYYNANTTEKYVRLVALANDYWYLNQIVTVNGTRYLVYPLETTSYQDIKSLNSQEAWGYDNWQIPDLAVLKAMYQRRKLIGLFKDADGNRKYGFKNEIYECKEERYGSDWNEYYDGIDFSNGSLTKRPKLIRPVAKMD